MLKDRGIKAEVLKYVSRKRWFPQLELEVLPELSTSRKATPITDIDVLALVPDEFQGYRKVLIDCKTKKSESPIARALWLSGLMDHVRATRGLIVMKRAGVAPDHRYLAAQRGILLLTEDDFGRYATATQGDPVSQIGYLAQIDLWERFFAIPSRFNTLERAVHFSRKGYWMSESPGHACRRSIAQLTRLASELDPKHPEHFAVLGDLASLFMCAIAGLASLIFPAHLQPETREEMSKALLLVLYGGKDAYDYRNALYKRFPKAHSADAELGVPNFGQFVQLVRNGLDAPVDAADAPLLLRELAWSSLRDAGTRIDLSYAKWIAGERRHTAKLAILGVEYLCKATGLPSEFSEAFAQVLIDVQVPEPTKTSAA